MVWRGSEIEMKSAALVSLLLPFTLSAIQIDLSSLSSSIDRKSNSKLFDN